MNCQDCGILLTHFDMHWSVANYGRMVCKSCGQHYEKQIQDKTCFHKELIDVGDAEHTVMACTDCETILTEGVI